MMNRVIDKNLLLDSRLALYHEEARWLALADLHYGYEISQRARGWLIPIWGMEDIESRLSSLIKEYQPTRLILVGDIVHSSVAQRAAGQFVQRLEGLGPELILIRGNHDRALRHLPLRDEFQLGSYRFHHGHQNIRSETGLLSVEGHIHPSWRFNNGTGTRLRAPALVQTSSKLILPAFSPWAAGVKMELENEYRLWACAGTRIFEVKGGI